MKIKILFLSLALAGINCTAQTITIPTKTIKTTITCSSIKLASKTSTITPICTAIIIIPQIVITLPKTFTQHCSGTIDLTDPKNPKITNQVCTETATSSPAVTQ